MKTDSALQYLDLQKQMRALRKAGAECRFLMWGNLVPDTWSADEEDALPEPRLCPQN